MTPITLSNQLSGIKLSAGDQTINYQHGPQIPSILSWPSSTNNNANSLIINSFNNNAIANTKYGPWGIFEILSSNQCSLEQKGNKTLLSININQYHAIFDIQTSSSIDTIELKPLSQLHPITKIGALS